MGKNISPERPHCACSGRFTKKQHRGEDYWSCEKCDKDPPAYRIRKSLPGLGKKDIRYAKDGTRITSMALAKTVAEQINVELRDFSFKPQKYRLKGQEETHTFQWLVETQYLPHYELLEKDGKITPYTLRAKKQYIRNYLLPFFTGVKQEKIKKKRITRAVLRGKGKRPDEYKEVAVKWASDVRSVYHIKSLTITQMYASLPCSQSMKDLVGQELKAILRWTHSDLELDGFSVPKFPAPKKKKLMNPDTFLTEEQNRLAFDHIKNDQYRIMLHLCWYYAMRPCEVRTLKWGDIDWKGEGTISINRHDSCGKILDGRKSQGEESHELPLEPEIRILLQGLARSIDPDAYMFPGVPENRLRKTWNAALKKAGIPHVDSYRGTKSSRLSQLLVAGWTFDEIQNLTGHSTQTMVKLYAQLTRKQKTEQIRKRLRASGGEL